MTRSIALGSVFLLVIALGLPAAEPVIPAPEAILKTLRAEHPRLLATAADFAKLKDQCEQAGQTSEWFARLQADANKLLSAPPLEYRIPDGKRLLAVSRAAKERVLLLGLVYRLTDEPKYAQRLWRELDTVTHFKDWNPSHFLDTAEMTFAVAIGYDWLYNTWTPEQRDQLRQAIVHLGLEQAFPVYEKLSSWAKAIHNWNQVCNGGMAVGALAIAEEEPELSRRILHDALLSLPRAMNEFAPDGGWGEGPGYWRYATEYNVYLLAALKTALGTDYGLSKMPGFSETGDFPLYFTGPSGQTFNYADAHSGWHGAPQLFWLATTFDRPAWAAHQLQHATSRLSPLDLLWGGSWADHPEYVSELPLNRHFEGVSVVFLRSAWDDPQATFVGIKGGDNRVNHGHLDLGTFVLDALGERWFSDLGSENYNLPSYFGLLRWDYYRCRAEGHNTLVLNPESGPDQDPRSTAPVISFDDQVDRAAATIDLTAAYASSAERVTREISLLNNRDVMLRDEITPNKPCEMWWFAHTAAAITLDDSCRTATLHQNGKTLQARILEPAQATFDVVEAAPMATSPHPAGQADESQGPRPARKLQIHSTSAQSETISVVFSPMY